MLVLLFASARAADPCEATCQRLSACLEDHSAAGIAQCQRECAPLPLGAETHRSIQQAPDCVTATGLLAMAMMNPSALAGAAAPPTAAPTAPAAPLPAAVSAPLPPSPSTPAPTGGPGPCPRPTEDAQVLQLFTATAWCSYGYGGATETKERYVLAADGRFQGRTGSETVRTGQNTNMYGEVQQTFGAWGSGVEQLAGCWQYSGERLAFSADGRTWAPGATALGRNSNGWPILTFEGKEYFTCD